MQTAFLYSLKCIYNIGLNSYKFILKTSNDEILTAKQIQKLQRENAQHKENLNQESNCHLYTTPKQRLSYIL